MPIEEARVNSFVAPPAPPATAPAGANAAFEAKEELAEAAAADPDNGAGSGTTPATPAAAAAAAAARRSSEPLADAGDRRGRGDPSPAQLHAAEQAALRCGPYRWRERWCSGAAAQQHFRHLGQL